MKKENYKSILSKFKREIKNTHNHVFHDAILSKFKREIKNTHNHVFHDVDNWTMANDIMNGVLVGYTINERSERVGYTINERSERELLHRIGLKYGLIPLCPGEVVDIDVSDHHKIMRSFVRTMFGKMQINPK
ncbi:MAG: hypothetical protein B6D58_10115 [candidate division Zixibacteria bacterium 4484_95]|nr:MAG: hypothetical protein B6D58_10115 [candidate division Zixibacteria bacterium 4484_95]